MKKRFSSLLMAVVLAVSLMSALSVTASAVNYTATSGYIVSVKNYGSSGYVRNANYAMWKLSNNTLTIYHPGGSGSIITAQVPAIGFFSANDNNIENQLDKSKVTKIVIEQPSSTNPNYVPISIINSSTLKGFPNLTEIVLNGVPLDTLNQLAMGISSLAFENNAENSQSLTITFNSGRIAYYAPVDSNRDIFTGVNTYGVIPELKFSADCVIVNNEYPPEGNAVSFKGGTVKYTPHTHTWGYTASNNVLTVKCVGNGNCPQGYKTGYNLVLSAPSNLTYNGTAKAATIGNWSAGIPSAASAKPTTVTYKGTNGTSYNSTTAPTNAGSYTASISMKGGNNVTATASVNFTIAKANLSPTVTLNGWTYGGTANNPSVSGNTGNGTVTYTYKAQGAEDSTYTTTKPTDAGNYTVKASIAATTNYNAATATKAFTIAKATPSLTPPTANNRTYDGSEQALVTAGTNVVGGTLKYRLSDGDYSENIPTATNAGTYTVYYKVFGGDANYNDTTEASVPVTIAKADASLTAPTANELTYDGTEQALVTAGSAEGGTMEYSTSENGVYSDAIPTATDAGEYTVWYKVKGDANHNDTTPDSVDVTIAKAEATDAMKTVTAHLYAFPGQTAEIGLIPLPDTSAHYGTPSNDNTTYFTLSDISVNGAIGTITATAAQTCPAETTTKTFTVPVNNSKNYNNYTIEVTVELVEMPVQTISVEKSTLELTYGDTNRKVSAANTTTVVSDYPVGDIEYSVLDEGGGENVVTVDDSGNLTIHGVGTAYVVAQAVLAEHYAPSEPVHITVHVAPKALTNGMLTLGTSEFTYDGGSKEPGYTVMHGSTELTHNTDYGVDSTSTTSAVNAGTYKIKINGIGNYTGSVEKTWKIQKADATVTAPTANDRTYDGNEQALVNAGTDVVGGTLKYSTSKTGTYSTDIPTATNAGSYTVWYKVEGDDNHNDVAATKIPVTIAKATPNITAPTAGEITYGQTLSDSTLTGGVASTDGSFAWKKPGTAPVVSDSDTTNYTVVFTPDDTTNYETVECNATLTVNKKPVDAVIDITAPKAKETAQTELAATDDFKAATITWSPELKNGKFEYNKEYTATVTLDLKDIDNTTIDGVTFTVDGAKADGVTIDGDTLTVVFTNTGRAPSSDSSNSITAPGSAENGEVSVDKKSASAGQTVTITVTPDKGYTLETLTVTDAKGNEVALTKVDDTTYTFKMPNGKVNVDATFMEDNTMLNYFVDVPVNEYYYDAVLWAVSNGITNGTDDTHFSPNMGVTRAHVVTFLWRAAGCPEPKGDASQFTDVVAGEYYEKAVAWAIENGITKGTSATTFSPDAICTRGQIVTFLARFAGVKDEAVGYTHGFTDVNAADYFNNAVAWAKDNKITEGTTATTFSPYEDCTRAQVVTFLYRLLNK